MVLFQKKDLLLQHIKRKSSHLFVVFLISLVQSWGYIGILLHMRWH